MLKTTTKSLIFISLILASAVALQDGDQVAFKTHGSHFNAQYQYLNAGTVDGSVGMAKNTDYASASGTWWKAHKLSDGSWAFESLGSIHNAQHIYLNANTYTGTLDLVGSTDYATVSGTHWSLQTLSDGNVALKSLGSFKNPKYQYLNVDTYVGGVGMASGTDYASKSGTHWEIVTLVPAATGIPAATSKLADFIQAHANDIATGNVADVNYCLQRFTSPSDFGPIIGAILKAGCTAGLETCDPNSIFSLISQLKDKGIDQGTIQQIAILIGSVVGGMKGQEVCAGLKACQVIGGKIGAFLACLSVSKEVFQGLLTAAINLENFTMKVGQVGQDTLKVITDTTDTVNAGVHHAIDQINQGSNDVITSLKDATNQVGQTFTSIGSSIIGGLTDAGGAIVGGATTAGGAIAGGATTAGGAIAGGATTAGGAIAGGATTAGGAIAGVGQQVASGFCGIFGC